MEYPKWQKFMARDIEVCRFFSQDVCKQINYNDNYNIIPSEGTGGTKPSDISPSVMVLERMKPMTIVELVIGTWNI